MNRSIVLVTICALFFFSSITPTSALLEKNELVAGQPIIHDTINNLWWVSDLSLFSNLNFTDVQNAVESLNYGGITNWSLASEEEVMELTSQYNDYNYPAELFQIFFTPTYQVPEVEVDGWAGWTATTLMPGTHIVAILNQWVPPPGPLIHALSFGMADNETGGNDVSAWRHLHIRGQCCSIYSPFTSYIFFI